MIPPSIGGSPVAGVLPIRNGGGTGSRWEEGSHRRGRVSDPALYLTRQGNACGFTRKWARAHFQFSRGSFEWAAGMSRSSSGRSWRPEGSGSGTSRSAARPAAGSSGSRWTETARRPRHDLRDLGAAVATAGSRGIRCRHALLARGELARLERASGSRGTSNAASAGEGEDGGARGGSQGPRGHIWPTWRRSGSHPGELRWSGMTSTRQGPSSSGDGRGAEHEPGHDRGAPPSWSARRASRSRRSLRGSRRRWRPPTSPGGSSSIPSSTRRRPACARRSTPSRGTCAYGCKSSSGLEHEGEEGEVTVETNVLSEQEVLVTDEFKGRIGAQTAKQVIFPEAPRRGAGNDVRGVSPGREGDVVTGIVQQLSAGTPCSTSARWRPAAAGRAGACRASPTATASA